VLRERLAGFGLAGRPIETFFDLLEADEDRDSTRERRWEQA
jgi:hypothetical protein